MSWNDRARRKLQAHANALMRELERNRRQRELGDYVDPVLHSVTLDRLQQLLDLLIDNAEVTLDPLRSFIETQLGGA